MIAKLESSLSNAYKKDQTHNSHKRWKVYIKKESTTTEPTPSCLAQSITCLGRELDPGPVTYFRGD